MLWLFLKSSWGKEIEERDHSTLLSFFKLRIANAVKYISISKLEELCCP